MLPAEPLSPVAAAVVQRFRTNEAHVVEDLAQRLEQLDWDEPRPSALRRQPTARRRCVSPDEWLDEADQKWPPSPPPAPPRISLPPVRPPSRLSAVGGSRDSWSSGASTQGLRLTPLALDADLRSNAPTPSPVRGAASAWREDRVGKALEHFRQARDANGRVQQFRAQSPQRHLLLDEALVPRGACQRQRGERRRLEARLRSGKWALLGQQALRPGTAA